MTATTVGVGGFLDVLKGIAMSGLKVAYGMLAPVVNSLN
jgi:hypothetical protein